MNIKRVDLVLVEKAQAKSRTEAQKLIAGGLVSINEAGKWRLVRKPSEKLSDSVELNVEYSPEQQFASRAGLKLEAALEQHSLSVEGLIALDVGQSTGGFTDCLLQRGAAHVVGVEVGHSQLVAHLRSDKRVTAIEQCNARYLGSEDMPPIAANGFDLVVMDVSFISQHLILPNLPVLMKPGAVLVSLVKPQFEVGREAIGKNGIVRDEACYKTVKEAILRRLQALGLQQLAYIDSPIKGGDGNREFLVIAKKCRETLMSASSEC
ncbi:TlyA family RNA methyltransferase [Teredinibacter haidensis]|uniref:TlyA family RNA methyltransferase n=1 Tax=Teredinibacter haidensis TaxID=2731755 RepID=UPI000948D756|nr:TlyA family RNA methyltransferase [Teredinibacter haidensis]